MSTTRADYGNWSKWKKHKLYSARIKWMSNGSRNVVQIRCNGCGELHQSEKCAGHMTILHRLLDHLKECR